MAKTTDKNKKSKNKDGMPLVLACFFTPPGMFACLVAAHTAGFEIHHAVWAICFLLFAVSLYFIIKRFKSINRDLSRLKHSNKRLRERELQYKSAFQNSSTGLAVFDARHHILEYNTTYEKIAGKPENDFVSMNLKAFCGQEDLPNGLKNGEPPVDLNGFSTLQRLVRPGSDIWARIRFTSLESFEDEKQSYLCIVEDLTENMSALHALRESERSKSVFLRNLPGMAYRCKYDRDWTMQFVSEGCFALTGYKQESLLNNRDLSYNELIFPAYREAIWNEWNRVLDQKTVFQSEYEIRTASGEAKWVYEQGQGIYDENGEICALEGLVFDITARKKRETENRYLTEHDLMTGLYNRGFFQQEKLRLDNESSLPLAIIIANINGVRLINDAFGHAEGDRLIIMASKVIKGLCRPNDVLARTGGDEFGILLPNTDFKTAFELVKSIKGAFLDYNGGVSKDAGFISLSLGCAVKTAEDENIDRIYKSAEEYMYKQKLLDRKSSHSAILSSIKATLFERSQETEEHAERLAKLSLDMGAKLNLPQTKLDELELLAILHDIGKIGINDRILNKPGSLSREEWEAMRKHPEIGFRIAMSSPVFQPIAECILFHHERWDGKGYPHGLRSNQIPLLARILAVADAYDAMTQDRPYRQAMARRDAILEIKENAGKQFDPEVVRIFLENESEN